MAYKAKVQVLDPEQWYDLISQEYKKYHKHLNSFDNGMISRFVPRDLKDLKIVDLWAWDGRLFNLLKNHNPGSWYACDISSQILSEHPTWENIHKIVCDLEKELPLESNIFDIAIAYFVLEHIQSLDRLFDEVYRILVEKWKFIIGHFVQRRAVIFQKNKLKFKINRYTYTDKQIEDFAVNSFFKIKKYPIYEHNVLIGHIFICEKQ